MLMVKMCVDVDGEDVDVDGEDVDGDGEDVVVVDGDGEDDYVDGEAMLMVIVVLTVGSLIM